MLQKLKFCVAAAVDVGCLGIPADQVERALDKEMRQCLVPGSLHASFSVNVADSEFPNGLGESSGNRMEQLLQEPTELSETDSLQRPGSIWGHKTLVGRPLKFTLEVIPTCFSLKSDQPAVLSAVAAAV